MELKNEIGVKESAVPEERLDPKGRAKFTRYVSLNILAMLGSSCYIVADTFFVANGVGADGLTALNLALSLFSFQQAVGLLLAIGSGTRYGICLSRGDAQQGSRVFTAALTLGIGVGLVIALLGNLFTGQLSAALGAEGEILDMTAEYLRVILTCVPFFISNHILVAFIRNDHNPKLATVALLISNASNVVLDYIFIYPLGWSMFGAAAATGLAPIISMCVLSLHFLQKKNRFHFTGLKAQGGLRRMAAAFADFFRLGVSSMVNELSVGIVIMLFNFLFLGIGGNTAVAAYGIVANVALFAVAIFTGIAQGVQPLVSDYYGRGVLGQLRIIRKDTMITAVSLAVILVGAAFFFTEGIVSVFNESGDPKLQAMAEEGLRIYFLGFIFAGVNIALTGYFSAMEQADKGFIISLLRGLLLIAPSAIIFAKLMGAKGIWLAVPVTEALTFAAVLWMIKKVQKRQQA